MVSDIKFSVPFDEDIVKSVFSGYSSLGRWNEATFCEYVKNMQYSAKVLRNEKIQYEQNEEIKELRGHIPHGIRAVESRRERYRFRKLSAERSISPEREGELYLDSTGEGASNLIRIFLNDSTYDETIIEKTLLNALNKIMRPEAEFESIRVQQVVYAGEKLWEVFLQEKGMQRVPLSKTGSGLKTIVLVLLNLLVIPQTKDYKNLQIVYGFEELENNLHPALQRRLFEFLYEFAVENQIILYITTHSHIAINVFFDKEEASIFHVAKSDGKAEIKCIETYIDKTEILEDLDVKASDIFQSNGIIWVEGPSDRIYIKRWLEIFTDNKYKEGQHYQFLYYGGRLLSQYSAEEETELINIITTNRNAAIVIDSDKRYRSASINDTKKRIIAEFSRLNMFSWVTRGKEIENYLPKMAIEGMLSISIKKECGQYELFPKYIEKYYNNFSQRKVPFANKIKEYITADDSMKVLDLKIQVETLYKQIEKWNKC